MEYWRKIPGHEGYEASDMGRIRSLKFGRERVLKPRFKNGGRATYNLGGKERDKIGSRLVLMAFVGLPLEGMEACHNDSNPSNDKLSNLRWDTKVGNMADKIENGTNRNASNTVSKLTEEEVVDILNIKFFYPQTTFKALGLLYGVSDSNIDFILKGHSWKHVFKEWEKNKSKEELV